MPRRARLDAPGVLHHVMARGIERWRLYRDDVDREAFVTRLDALCVEGEAVLYLAVVQHGLTPTTVAAELGMSRRSGSRALERAKKTGALPADLIDRLR